VAWARRSVRSPVVTSPERRFDAVLFDFSGVMTASAFGAMARLGAGGGHGEAAVLDLMLGPYAEDTDHPWHRVERGEIPVTDWVTETQREADERGITIDWSAMRHMLGELTVHEAMVDEVRALRADGYAVALVTNNVQEGSSAWRSLLPIDELFPVVVDSSEVGMRKPDPRIYLLALERLGGIEPARAVFLDDAPGNVEGARRAGLTAIEVGDPAEAVTELRRLLGR